MKDNGPVNMHRKQDKTQTIIDRPQISFLTNSERKERKQREEEEEREDRGDNGVP